MLNSCLTKDVCFQKSIVLTLYVTKLVCSCDCYEFSCIV